MSSDGPEEPPAERGVHQYVEASGDARVTVSGRDLHQHFYDGTRSRRRAETGADPDALCPFPGLAAFGPDQARWFFGRDELVTDLVTCLGERIGSDRPEPIFVVGSSGAGKSSLLRAGLTAKIADGRLATPGSRNWPRLIFTPTARPMTVLSGQIRALAADPDVGAVDPTALAHPADPADPVALLRSRLRGPGRRAVLIVDQFEELFTLCDDERERNAFIETLVELSASSMALVVCGLRADFYDKCTDIPRLRGVLQNGQILVGAMSEAELREAILFPARDVELEVEPGLVEVLLRDLGSTAVAPGEYEAGRLPLLAHALRTTWQQRHGSVLTVDSYQQTGGIARALRNSAEQLYSGLSEPQQQALHMALLHLVNIGDAATTADTRRKAAYADVLDKTHDRAAAEVALDVFTRGRLLIREKDDVEITHEVLLHAWHRLRRWIDDDRAGNLYRQELERAAADWAAAGLENGLLYRGSRLDTARAWGAEAAHRRELSAPAKQFLAASLRQTRRTAWIRRAAVGLLSILTLFASSAAVYAFQQQNTAMRQRDNAVFHQVSSVAGSLRASDSALAAQLDIVAFRMRQTDDLHTDLINAGADVLATTVARLTEPVAAMAISRDGRVLAEATGQLQLWNISDPLHPLPFAAPVPGSGGTAIGSVAFDPTRDILARGGADGSIRMIDVTDPAHIKAMTDPISAHSSAVGELAFSPDGRLLAMSSIDGTMSVWNVADPAHPVRLTPSEPSDGAVLAGTPLAFSPNGRILARGRVNGDIELYDATDPVHLPPLGKLTGHTGFVMAVAFSPDGRTLASGGTDSTIRLWNVADPARAAALAKPLNGHTNSVNVLAFSPDGRLLASGSSDSTVRLWNVADPATPTALGPPLTGHRSAVSKVVFANDSHALVSSGADGSMLLWHIPLGVMAGFTNAALSRARNLMATSSADGSLQMWDVSDPGRPALIGSTPAGLAASSAGIEFSPDGRLLGVGQADGLIQLWNVADLGHISPAGPAVAGVSGLTYWAFSPDGRLLAVTGGGKLDGTGDNTIHLWNVSDPAHPLAAGPPLTGNTGVVLGFAFSADSTLLASAAAESQIRLWDVSDPAHSTSAGSFPVGGVNAPVAVAFSPRGRTLATGMLDGRVDLWDVTDPAKVTLRTALVGHSSAVATVLFSPDGRTLATAGNDHQIRLWHVADPAHATPDGGPLIGHTDLVTGLEFNGAGTTIASLSADRVIRLWSLDPHDAIRQICAATGHLLTRDLWNQYVSPDTRYAPACV